jgi:nucleoside-diphosphate-sugar epimerase
VNVLITGGAGFLGARLAREILRAGELAVAGGEPAPLSRLTLLDQVPPPADLAADPRVAVRTASLGSAAGECDLGTFGEIDVVFHLAAAVSGECEADFDLGMRVNLRGTQHLLAACRAAGSAPVVVYASSVAVFGPGTAADDTMPAPRTSYGTQKAIGEYLLADYTRKGFLRGRALRLATISVRPGRPNAAASGFLSGIIREPLAGLRAACPVDPATEAVLASPGKAIAGLLRAASAADGEWGGLTAVNLPALSVSVAEMVAALARAAGPSAAELIDFVPDPAVAQMVANWPSRIVSARGARLGLTPDPDYDSVIAAYLAER